MVASLPALSALVVDDDQGIRASVGDVLRADGFQTLAAESCEQAMEFARVYPVHFGIVDVHVSADDGLRIVGSVRQFIPHFPFILMSGDLTPEIVARARALDAYDCLEKPLDVGMLRRAVQRLIDLEELG